LISHLLEIQLVFNYGIMHVDLGIWDKLTRFVIFLLFLAGLLCLGLWYLPLIKKNEGMRKEILRLDAQIQKGKETAKQSQAAIDALRSDPRAVERLAREQWGYAKPGETVIRFEPRATNNPH
jgi:cell division protein FtsB